MSKDIEKLQAFYKREGHGGVATVLGVAARLSRLRHAPEHIPQDQDPHHPMVDTNIYTIAGLDRKSHMEEVIDVDDKQVEYETFRASLEMLAEQYVIGVASGVKRLTQMPDLYSPEGILQSVSDETFAYFRRRGVFGNKWEAQIAYRYDQLEKRMNIQFKQKDHDDIVIDRVSMHYKLPGAESKPQVIYTCSDQRLSTVRFDWISGRWKNQQHRDAMKSDMDEDYAALYYRLFVHEAGREQKNVGWYSPNKGSLQFDFQASPTLTVRLKEDENLHVDHESRFIPDVSGRGFIRHLPDKAINQLRRLQVSTSSRLTYDEFLELVRGTLAFTPLVSLSKESK